jgi:protein O-GlcNAc transferase
MGQVTIQQAFDLAVRDHGAGRLQEAEQLYRQILAQQPNHAGALHHLGVIACQSGRNDVAVDLIRRSITLDPNCAEAHSNLGAALRNVGQLDAAISACRAAVALRPNYAEAHNNLGNALRDGGQLDAAIDVYRQAITISPNFAKAHSNLGNALTDKGRFDEAIVFHRRALACNPGLPEARVNLGNALRDAGQLGAAIAAYRHAIALRPNLPEAYSNLGNALKDIGQLDAAVAAYRQAIALRPDFADANSSLLYSMHFHPDYDSRRIAEAHRRWSRRHAEPLGRFIQPHANDPSPDRPLRIGYVSPDFRDHVVGRNLLPLFLQHDHRQFQITCYSNVRHPDAMTSQFQQNADCWRAITGLSDEHAAEQIRADQIDILVDLTLHMAGNRLLAFARKPAPVQVTYLAYCGSSGMSAMDYRLSDPHLDPPDTDLSGYSEETVRVPRTYWCYQPAITDKPSPPPVLDNGFVTFGCLNNFAKVSPAALDLWARILLAVPNSRLLIHASTGSCREDVLQRMERAGVGRERLHFVGKQPLTAYTQTYSRIDIALDPFPYAGGITTCDALWMGVPVVTLSGGTAVGRGGRSILWNLGLSELVASAPDEYVQIAIELARNVDRMGVLRRGMRARMLASPLMDAEVVARDIEAAYREMWRGWCTSQAAAR